MTTIFSINKLTKFCIFCLYYY